MYRGGSRRRRIWKPSNDLDDIYFPNHDDSSPETNFGHDRYSRFEGEKRAQFEEAHRAEDHANYYSNDGRNWRYREQNKYEDYGHIEWDGFRGYDRQRNAHPYRTHARDYLSSYTNNNYRNSQSDRTPSTSNSKKYICARKEYSSQSRKSSAETVGAKILCEKSAETSAIGPKVGENQTNIAVQEDTERVENPADSSAVEGPRLNEEEPKSVTQDIYQRIPTVVSGKVQSVRSVGEDSAIKNTEEDLNKPVINSKEDFPEEVLDDLARREDITTKAEEVLGDQIHLEGGKTTTLPESTTVRMETPGEPQDNFELVSMDLSDAETVCIDDVEDTVSHAVEKAGKRPYDILDSDDSISSKKICIETADVTEIADEVVDLTGEDDYFVEICGVIYSGNKGGFEEDIKHGPKEAESPDKARHFDDVLVHFQRLVGTGSPVQELDGLINTRTSFLSTYVSTTNDDLIKILDANSPRKNLAVTEGDFQKRVGDGNGHLLDESTLQNIKPANVKKVKEKHSAENDQTLDQEAETNLEKRSLENDKTLDQNADENVIGCKNQRVPSAMSTSAEVKGNSRLDSESNKQEKPRDISSSVERIVTAVNSAKIGNGRRRSTAASQERGEKLGKDSHDVNKNAKDQPRSTDQTRSEKHSRSQSERNNQAENENNSKTQSEGANQTRYEQKSVAEKEDNQKPEEQINSKAIEISKKIATDQSQRKEKLECKKESNPDQIQVDKRILSDSKNSAQETQEIPRQKAEHVRSNSRSKDGNPALADEACHKAKRTKIEERSVKKVPNKDSAQGENINVKTHRRVAMRRSSSSTNSVEETSQNPPQATELATSRSSNKDGKPALADEAKRPKMGEGWNNEQLNKTSVCCPKSENSVKSKTSACLNVKDLEINGKSCSGSQNEYFQKLLEGSKTEKRASGDIRDRSYALADHDKARSSSVSEIDSKVKNQNKPPSSTINDRRPSDAKRLSVESDEVRKVSKSEPMSSSAERSVAPNVHNEGKESRVESHRTSSAADHQRVRSNSREKTSASTAQNKAKKLEQRRPSTVTSKNSVREVTEEFRSKSYKGNKRDEKSGPTNTTSGTVPNRELVGKISEKRQENLTSENKLVAPIKGGSEVEKHKQIITSGQTMTIKKQISSKDKKNTTVVTPKETKTSQKRSNNVPDVKTSGLTPTDKVTVKPTVKGIKSSNGDEKRTPCKVHADARLVKTNGEKSTSAGSGRSSKEEVRLFGKSPRTEKLKMKSSSAACNAVVGGNNTKDSGQSTWKDEQLNARPSSNSVAGGREVTESENNCIKEENLAPERPGAISKRRRNTLHNNTYYKSELRSPASFTDAEVEILMRTRSKSCDSRDFTGNSSLLDSRQRSKSVCFTEFRVTRSKAALFGICEGLSPLRRRTSVSSLLLNLKEFSEKGVSAHTKSSEETSEKENSTLIKTSEAENEDVTDEKMSDRSRNFIKESDEHKGYKPIRIDFGTKPSRAYSPRYDDEENINCVPIYSKKIAYTQRLDPRDPRKSRVESTPETCITNIGRELIRYGDYMQKAQAPKKDASETQTEQIKNILREQSEVEGKGAQNVLSITQVKVASEFETSEIRVTGDGGTTSSKPNKNNKISLQSYRKGLKQKTAGTTKSGPISNLKNRKARSQKRKIPYSLDPDYVPFKDVHVLPWDAQLRIVNNADRDMPIINSSARINVVSEKLKSGDTKINVDMADIEHLFPSKCQDDSMTLEVVRTSVCESSKKARLQERYAQISYVESMEEKADILVAKVIVHTARAVQVRNRRNLASISHPVALQDRNEDVVDLTMNDVAESPVGNDLTADSDIASINNINRLTDELLKPESEGEDVEPVALDDASEAETRAESGNVERAHYGLKLGVSDAVSSSAKESRARSCGQAVTVTPPVGDASVEVINRLPSRSKVAYVRLECQKKQSPKSDRSESETNRIASKTTCQDVEVITKVVSDAPLQGTEAITMIASDEPLQDAEVSASNPVVQSSNPCVTCANAGPGPSAEDSPVSKKSVVHRRTSRTSAENEIQKRTVTAYLPIQSCSDSSNPVSEPLVKHDPASKTSDALGRTSLGGTEDVVHQERQNLTAQINASDVIIRVLTTEEFIQTSSSVNFSSANSADACGINSDTFLTTSLQENSEKNSVVTLNSRGSPQLATTVQSAIRLNSALNSATNASPNSRGSPRQEFSITDSSQLTPNLLRTQRSASNGEHPNVSVCPSSLNAPLGRPANTWRELTSHAPSANELTGIRKLSTQVYHTSGGSENLSPPFSTVAPVCVGGQNLKQGSRPSQDKDPSVQSSATAGRGISSSTLPVPNVNATPPANLQLPAKVLPSAHNLGVRQLLSTNAIEREGRRSYRNTLPAPNSSAPSAANSRNRGSPSKVLPTSLNASVIRRLSTSTSVNEDHWGGGAGAKSGIRISAQCTPNVLNSNTSPGFTANANQLQQAPCNVLPTVNSNATPCGNPSNQIVPQSTERLNANITANVHYQRSSSVLPNAGDNAAISNSVQRAPNVLSCLLRSDTAGCISGRHLTPSSVLTPADSNSTTSCANSTNVITSQNATETLESSHHSSANATEHQRRPSNVLPTDHSNILEALPCSSTRRPGANGNPSQAIRSASVLEDSYKRLIYWTAHYVMKCYLLYSYIESTSKGFEGKFFPDDIKQAELPHIMKYAESRYTALNTQLIQFYNTLKLCNVRGLQFLKDLSYELQRNGCHINRYVQVRLLAKLLFKPNGGILDNCYYGFAEYIMQCYSYVCNLRTDSATRDRSAGSQHQNGPSGCQTETDRTYNQPARPNHQSENVAAHNTSSQSLMQKAPNMTQAQKEQLYTQLFIYNTQILPHVQRTRQPSHGLQAINPAQNLELRESTPQELGSKLRMVRQKRNARTARNSQPAEHISNTRQASSEQAPPRLIVTHHPTPNLQNANFESITPPLPPPYPSRLSNLGSNGTPNMTASLGGENIWRQQSYPSQLLNGLLATEQQTAQQNMHRQNRQALPPIENYPPNRTAADASLLDQKRRQNGGCTGDLNRFCNQKLTEMARQNSSALNSSRYITDLQQFRANTSHKPATSQNSLTAQPAPAQNCSPLHSSRHIAANAPYRPATLQNSLTPQRAPAQNFCPLRSFQVITANAPNKKATSHNFLTAQPVPAQNSNAAQVQRNTVTEAGRSPENYTETLTNTRHALIWTPPQSRVDENRVESHTLSGSNSPNFIGLRNRQNCDQNLPSDPRNSSAYEQTCSATEDATLVEQNDFNLTVSELISSHNANDAACALPLKTETEQLEDELNMLSASGVIDLTISEGANDEFECRAPKDEADNEDKKGLFSVDENKQGASEGVESPAAGAEFVDLENYFAIKHGEVLDDDIEMFWPDGYVVMPQLHPVKGENGDEEAGLEDDPIPRTCSNDSGVESPEVEIPGELFEGRNCMCGQPAVYVCPCKSVMYCSDICQGADWQRHSDEHIDQ